VGRWENKYVIGLTGNIATGKSLVRRMLEHLGAYTIDADGLTHQAMAPGAPAYKPVVITFGQWILDAEHRIDRTKLGAVAFAHPDALARLEALTHPIIGQALDTLIQRSRHPVIVVEAIKLLEGPLANQVDAVWVVSTTEEQQLDRLIKRGLTRDEAIKRIRVQNPQGEKIARANVVILNNGSPEEAWAQVRLAWSKIKGAAEAEAAQQQVQRVEIQPAAGAATRTPSGAMTMAITSLDIVRGNPRNASQISQLILKQTGRQLSERDILMAFGQKSYMIALANGEPVGLVGFLVENLVTRVDEFMIMKHAPVGPVAKALIDAFERASRELQSEVGYVFVPPSSAPELAQALNEQGYKAETLEEIKVPAWREAVRESRPEGTAIFSKKLRAERVLKPL
jgi:dephospho-CoA kinase